MNDSRIDQAAALVDDARTLLADMEEDGVSSSDAPDLAAARRLSNSALYHLNKLKDTAAQPFPGW